MRSFESFEKTVIKLRRFVIAVCNRLQCPLLRWWVGDILKYSEPCQTPGVTDAGAATGTHWPDLKGAKLTLGKKWFPSLIDLETIHLYLFIYLLADSWPFDP